MLSEELNIRYIGGPTALLEVEGLHFLTDPTFDPAETSYPTPVYTLHKTKNPLVHAEELSQVDYVLLSHDHHFDNLDHAGRKFLPTVKTVFTTQAGAERLGGNTVGLANWQTIDLLTENKRILQITGTPCRHGPVDGDRGPVTGFILQFKDDSQGAVYITGDTVWYEGLEEVAKRFDVRLALLFMGAAVVKEVGKDHLTMNAEEGVLFARHFPHAKLIPLHYEGWTHFSESPSEIKQVFEKAGLQDRLQLM